MKKFFFGLLMMLAPLSMSAQEYHSAAMYEATGPVKEIVFNKVKKEFKKQTVKFLESGREEWSLMTFNDEGYPVNSSQKVGALKENIDITWNPDNTVAGIEQFSDVLGKSGMSISFSYAGSSAPSGMKVEYWKPKKGTDERVVSEIVEYTFSDYEYDSHGNWIGRKVVKVTEELGKKPKTSQTQYIQTRTISYY